MIYSSHLGSFGPFVASAELAEQQVIVGHDGGGFVGGENVCDLRAGVTQSLRHVRQHGGVQVFWTQPGEDTEEADRMQIGTSFVRHTDLRKRVIVWESWTP